jgi:hypothetical protein
MLMPLLYATSSEGSSPSPRGGAKAAIASSSPSGSVVAAGRGRSYYRVHDSETLDGIAGRFGVDRASIARDNALDPTASLRGGQLLLINVPAPSDGSPGDSHAHR